MSNATPKQAELAAFLGRNRHKQGCGPAEVAQAHVLHAARRFGELLRASVCVARARASTSPGEGGGQGGQLPAIPERDRVLLRIALRAEMSQRLASFHAVDDMYVRGKHVLRGNTTPNDAGAAVESQLPKTDQGRATHTRAADAAATRSGDFHFSDSSMDAGAIGGAAGVGDQATRAAHEQFVVLASYRAKMRANVMAVGNEMLRFISAFACGLEDCEHMGDSTAETQVAVQQAGVVQESPMARGATDTHRAATAAVRLRRVLGAVKLATRVAAAVRGAGVGAAAAVAVAKRILGVDEDVVDALALAVRGASAAQAETAVFLVSLAADVRRRLSEVEDTESAARQKQIGCAKHLYKRAAKLCQLCDLDPTHPLQLVVVLNYSVFLHDVAREPADATWVAKWGFQAAVTELHVLADERYKESTLLMQLIRHNIALWEFT